MLSAPSVRALDAMDEIAACWRAISALASPDATWTPDVRSDFAILTDKLARDYEAARDQFTAASRLAA
ncbi:hypothetical protein THICB3320748 [Thiomonas sp. CB3]|nr:hypothetical protein THICB3320748 [Thiomonas sp. CB3]